jgi:Zn-dependent membrane protease YugP
MIVAIGLILLLLLAYGPHLWVKYVLKRHSTDIKTMSGTGGELAQHLVERFKLDGVKVEIGVEGQDHYNPSEKLISLSPSVYNGKSITAVSVATHEVGHAIQFIRKEPVSLLREKYLGKAFVIKKIGTAILLGIPVVTIVFKMPHIMLFLAIIGIITMLASALMYVAILPEEYDASFKKALPILKEGYVPSDYIPAVEQVLRAAALTYLAAALADILRLWTWLRVFR